MASAMPSITFAQDGQLAPGSCLSNGCQYQIQSFVGEGSFGKVAKCTTMADQKTVAIKIFKNNTNVIQQAVSEIAALEKLRSLNADQCNIVQWDKAFFDQGHICIKFEHLHKSLSDLLTERNFQPLLLKEIRPIVQQLANALYHLKTIGIIHADLKLDNVMLVDHDRQPFRVKVIDFGLARDTSEATLCSYLQTRSFRAPEIVLGLPFTEAIDMWSLGCLAATLYLGTLLYPAMSEYDLMRYINETVGNPPDHLLNQGIKSEQFFEKHFTFGIYYWRLKDPQQYLMETGIQPLEMRQFKLTSLHDLMHIHFTRFENDIDEAAAKCDMMNFVEMLSGMLQLDRFFRLTPSHVLDHDFISMCHIRDMYELSQHVRSCFELMEDCQKNTNTQPPPTNSEESNHRPSTSMKRKIDNKDGDNDNMSKKLKATSDHHEHGGTAAPSTVDSQGSSTSKRKTAHSEERETKKSRTQLHDSCASSSLISLTRKRKVVDGEDSPSGHESTDCEKKRARKCHQSRSTHGSHEGFTETHHCPYNLRKRSEQHQHSDTHLTSSTERRVKRKRPNNEDVWPKKHRGQNHPTPPSNVLIS